MTRLKSLLTCFVFLFCSGIVLGQGGSRESRIGEFMRSTERSYVVIAVMLTILAGLVLYVIRLDRKIRRLEKEK